MLFWSRKKKTLNTHENLPISNHFILLKWIYKVRLIRLIKLTFLKMSLYKIQLDEDSKLLRKREEIYYPKLYRSFKMMLQMKKQVSEK
jgi:hypothetical protein